MHRRQHQRSVDGSGSCWAVEVDAGKQWIRWWTSGLFQRRYNRRSILAALIFNTASFDRKLSIVRTRHSANPTSCPPPSSRACIWHQLFSAASNAFGRRNDRHMHSIIATQRHRRWHSRRQRRRRRGRGFRMLLGRCTALLMQPGIRLLFASHFPSAFIAHHRLRFRSDNSLSLLLPCLLLMHPTVRAPATRFAGFPSPQARCPPPRKG